MKKLRFICALSAALLLFNATFSALAAALDPAAAADQRALGEVGRPETEPIGLDLALNVIGGSLHFETGEHPFAADLVDGRIAAVSGNAGMDGTESSVTLTLDMLAGETMSFDYKCSTEYGGDIFTFSVNGERELLRSGEWDWSGHTYTAESSGSHTFVWKYQKDSGMGSGSDCVWLDEIAYSGDQGAWIPGDANGNGAVSATDALLTMRFAIGIIGEHELIFHNADIDGDGSVSLLDAVWILRVALGIG